MHLHPSSYTCIASVVRRHGNKVDDIAYVSYDVLFSAENKYTRFKVFYFSIFIVTSGPPDDATDGWLPQ